MAVSEPVWAYYDTLTRGCFFAPENIFSLKMTVQRFVMKDGEVVDAKYRCETTYSF